MQVGNRREHPSDEREPSFTITLSPSPSRREETPASLVNRSQASSRSKEVKDLWRQVRALHREIQRKERIREESQSSLNECSS